MMTTLKKITLAIGLITITSLTAIGQQDYPVGFKVISTYDSNRKYKPNTSLSDKLFYRPIDIDLWYPAEITLADTTASFVDLVKLLEQRSNFYDDTRRYDGLTKELLQHICAGLHCTNPDTLRRIETKSYVNAKPIGQQFPLIVYFAGLNGMSYENYLLFESLTKKGFVVASVSSVGRFPGNMTMDPDDIFEQINDANFVIDYLTKRNLASRDIGLIGYSWGGLAATIMAMREKNRIKAIVSLDGSEQFAYVDEEENEKMTRIRKASFFKPEAINSSFLHLDSDASEWDDLPDSIYNIADHILRDKLYLKIDHATHEDFSSLSSLLRDNKTDSKHSMIQKLTIDYMMDKLKGEDVFYKNIPNEGIIKKFSQPRPKPLLKPTEKNILRGVISDRKSNLPLPYVNIGIINKNVNVGTTSNIKGEFELPLLASNANDTLRVSMIGYQPAVIYLSEVFQKKKSILNIQLQEREDELKEIVITEKKLTKRVLGNKTESKFFGGRFASGDLGSEIVIKIRIKEAPTFLDTFSFNISYNEGDASTFRVNIYEIENGLSGKNVLTENILIKISGQTDKIDVDLSKYNATVNSDFFIGLEWVEGKRNSGIVFSSGFVKKGTYYRKASQGRWRKFPMGVGFNVTAKY